MLTGKRTTFYQKHSRASSSALFKVIAGTLQSFLFVACFFSVSPSYGQQREVSQYLYDEAGNIVSVSTDVISAPPLISSVFPNIVRRGSAVRITLSGTNLANGNVSSSSDSLIVSETNAQNSEVTFNLSASLDAPLGTNTLTLSTSLGSVITQITVEPELPALLVSPLPVVVVEGGEIELGLSLSREDVRDHTFELEVANAELIELSGATIVIPAGQRKPLEPITLSGLSAGATNIRVAAPDFGSVSLTVFVGAQGQLPEGNNTLLAPPLGVLLEPEPPAPDIETRGPFKALLGVVKQANDEGNSSFSSLLAAPNLKVVKGSGLSSVTPRVLLAGSGPTDLVLTGVGLGEVDDIRIVPDDGITVGDISTANDGESLVIPVSVSAETDVRQRRIQLAAAGRVLAPITTFADRIYIGGQAPTIESIDPITVQRGQRFELTLRGEDLDFARSVSIEPSEGVVVSASPEVSDDGSKVTLAVDVSASAELGSRVVMITTPAGSSTETSLPSNTLSITSRQGTVNTPVAAPALGIVRSVPEPALEQDLTHYTTILGVSKGSVLSNISPSTGEIGSELSITVSGTQLQNVDGVEFIPASGVEVGEITPASDGNSLTVGISIASDASISTRRIRLSSGGDGVPVSIGGNDRFRVTTLQPEIESISPNFLLADGLARDFILRGQRFVDIQSVRVVPSLGITVNTPEVSAEGDSVSVQITAGSGAALGPRTVIVETIAGTTAPSLEPANTLEIVSDVDNIFESFVSPALGVLKQIEPPAPPPVTQVIRSTAVGIAKEVEPAPVNSDINLSTPVLGVVVGTAVDQVLPGAVAVNSSATLTISGTGLDEVTEVRLEPDTGIALGALSVSENQLSLPVDVAADAPQILRRILINTNGGALRTSDASIERLQISGPPALIESISPIQETRGANFTMLIRGRNLQTAQNVQMLPVDTRVSLGPPSVNEEGTELRLQVNITDTALAGQRIVVVTTLAGETTRLVLPANTFTVVDE